MASRPTRWLVNSKGLVHIAGAFHWVAGRPAGHNAVAMNAGQSMPRRRRATTRRLPRSALLTTGVRGWSVCHGVTVDGRPFVNEWHCRIPKGLAGFRHQADWKVRDAAPAPSTQPPRAAGP